MGKAQIKSRYQISYHLVNRLKAFHQISNPVFTQISNLLVTNLRSLILIVNFMCFVHCFCTTP